MEENQNQSEIDVESEISYWGKEFEKISEDVNKLLKNENELYQNQLEEITKNYQQKLADLDEWKQNSENSIEKDRELKIQYLKEDCEIKKSEIPTFMKQSIKKQFSRLKNEFSDVFDLFLDQDIPFINEFTNEEKESVYEVDLSKRPFLSANEIKEDENNLKNIKDEYKIAYGELKNNSKSYRIGSNVSVQFEKMSPIQGYITNITDSTIEFKPDNAAQTITFPLQALNIRIIKLK